MLSELAVGQIKEIGKRFRISTSCFEAADAAFSPKEGLNGVAYNIAHAAESIAWLAEGAFNKSGFDMDFEGSHKRVHANSTSLAAARKHFEACLSRAVITFTGKSDEEMMAKMPAGPVLGGQPRFSIVEAISDHTASHRGTLGVYARLLGKTPKMPYGEE